MGCGICGFVGLSDKALLRSMCQVSRHRGPDDTKYYLDANVGLGINRLKIIDLVKGEQPIHNEDGSVWIVFNGEIYNYGDLRKELESEGHRFYTESDTETIVHSYEQWGERCVEHLRGMFAFAIWDAKRKRLYLARDRFGKKPLYYTLVDGVLLFSSEIKSILKFQKFDRRMNSEALDYFLTFMYVPSPWTIFSGIHKLPQACYAIYEDGRLRIDKYWDITFSPDETMTEDEATERIYIALRDAVRVRLQSDVPLGAFLSGGIDSSTVVSLMSRLTDQEVKTVSIGFDHQDSELPYSRVVAEKLHTDHHEFVVTPEMHKVLPDLIWHFDEPFADHSMIPTYYLSEVTRREVTVALSGDGGDEMFLGYPFLADPESFGAYSVIPSFLRRSLLYVAKNLPIDRQFRRAANHAYEKNYGDQPYDERYAMRVSMFSPSGLAKLYSKEAIAGRSPVDTYALVRNLARDSMSPDQLTALDYVTIRSYLADDILVKVDRMSMARSLEVRCPLLDQDLTDVVRRIPSRMKMNGNTAKYIFKKMVVKKGLLPPEIANRRKQGFGAPIEAWMKGEWKDFVSESLDPILSGKMNLLNREEVVRLAKDPYVNSGRLFALVVFLIWYDMYIENEPKQPNLHASIVT